MLSSNEWGWDGWGMWPALESRCSCKENIRIVLKTTGWEGMDWIHIAQSNVHSADPSGRAVWGMGVRPFRCWDCGFESHQCMDVILLCVVWCKLEISAKGLISRTESYRLWCFIVCDLESSWMRRPWTTGGCCTKRKKVQ